jgi:FkbM family methyltransferase
MQPVTQQFPISVTVAFLWAKHGPRARGAVARIVGRWQRSRPPLFIKTLHGAALSVDYDNLDVYANIHNNGGCWDENVMRCCKSLLRPNEVFYDIGANAGVFSVDLAVAIENLTVVSFEPQPSLAEHVRRSIDANGLARIDVIEAMLGEEDRTASLFLTSHSIHASAIPRESRFRELLVPMHRLDSLIREDRLPPPDVIKIDVEGGELSAFRGATETLRLHQPSIVFEADYNTKRMGYTTGDLLATMSAAVPYEFFLIDETGAARAVPPSHPDGNYVALSPRHADRRP